MSKMYNKFYVISYDLNESKECNKKLDSTEQVMEEIIRLLLQINHDIILEWKVETTIQVINNECIIDHKFGLIEKLKNFNIDFYIAMINERMNPSYKPEPMTWEYDKYQNNKQVGERPENTFDKALEKIKREMGIN